MAKRDLLRNIILLLLVVCVFIGLRIWVFDLYKIKNQDANHYLKTGDYILAMKNELPKYGEFVLYEVNGKDHVGRIIATENDKVTYMDDVLYLNDKIKTEDYLLNYKEKYQASLQNGGYFTHDFTIATLPKVKSDKVTKNSYLILNDNRKDTSDSRSFGLVSQKQIRGVIHFRLFPLNKFGFIENK